MKIKINYLTSFDGEKLFTQEFSSNPQINQYIFLTHGIGGDSNAMLLLVEQILKEIPNTCCVVWDLRGHGFSTNQFDNKNSLEYLNALDLHQIIQKYKPKKFYLVGHSLGGITSHQYLIEDFSPSPDHTFIVSSPIKNLGYNPLRKIAFYLLTKFTSPTKKKRTLEQFKKNKETIDFDIGRIIQDIQYTGLINWILIYFALFGWKNIAIEKSNTEKLTIIYNKQDWMIHPFFVKKQLASIPKANSVCLDSNHHRPPLKNYSQIADLLKDKILSNT